MLLRLYSKRRCPLCEVALGVLRSLNEKYGEKLDIEIRHIEDSPSDYARFRYDVPVLFVGASEDTLERAFEHRFTVDDVEKRLHAHGMRVAQTPPRDA